MVFRRAVKPTRYDGFERRNAQADKGKGFESAVLD